VIRVDGELRDGGECLYLDLAVRDVERTAPANQIILDLQRVSFVGSNGLRVLVNAGRRSASNGSRLQMTRGNGHLGDMLRLTALDQARPFADPALLPAIRGE
jgi:anti-anti-sigma factor